MTTLEQSELQTREWLTHRVYETVDAAVMTLGELLELGREKLGKALYEHWVLNDLPFGLETARRYRAIHRAYVHLPEKQLRLLPRPWQAMYALHAIEPAQLAVMIDDGTIGPKTTVIEAKRVARIYRQDRYTGEPEPVIVAQYTEADEAARALMEYDVRELTPKFRQALDSWLTSPRHRTGPSRAAGAR